MANSNNRPRKAKSDIRHVVLTIVSGPSRSEIYHESEICLDLNGSPQYGLKFAFRARPDLSDTVFRACVTGVEHADGQRNVLRLSGHLNVKFAGTEAYVPYPFTAFYDTAVGKGNLNLRVPRSLQLPTAKKIPAPT